MTSDDRDRADVVDARLLDRFALFRAPRSPESLDHARAADIEKVLASRGASRLGLVGSLARAVRVNPSLTIVAIPGSDGVLLLVTGRDGRTAGFGGSLESVLSGRPIGSSGPLIFGMAPDGVATQTVELRDGSRISVPVARNLYATEDPSWQPPVFAND